jgi:hypothetical protein
VAKTREETILEFRKAFAALSDKDRVAEAARLVRVTQRIPIIVFEDWERNKSIKFLDVNNLIEYFWQEKKIRADRSFVYKVLKGQFKEAYGFKIYYYYEEV